MNNQLDLEELKALLKTCLKMTDLIGFCLERIDFLKKQVLLMFTHLTALIFVVSFDVIWIKVISTGIILYTSFNLFLHIQKENKSITKWAKELKSHNNN